MIIVISLLVLAFSAGSAVAEDDQPVVHALPFPSITLNVTKSAFYNLSFVGLELHTPVQNYATLFHENHWTFTKYNNTTYYYQGKVAFTSGGSIQDGSVTPDASQEDNNQSPMLATVNLTLSALDYSLNNVQINNTTSPMHGSGYLFPNYSVMEISISITFQQAVQGPGTLLLVQLIKSSNSSKSAVQYYLGNVSHNLTDRMHGDHMGLQVIPDRALSANNSAFYWWNNTFSLNGVENHSMRSMVGLGLGGIVIAFAFPFNSTLKSIYEDPFLGVPGTHLFQNPIIKQGINDLVAYLVIHAEFLGAGTAVGIGFLGISYSFYRRRKL